MNYILSDGPRRDALLPFTFTRPVAEIRIGILTIREKWEKYLATPVSFKTEDYLSEKYPMVEKKDNIVIISSFLPTPTLLQAIDALQMKEGLFWEEQLVAYRTGDATTAADISKITKISFTEPIPSVDYTWDIFSKNGEALQADFDLVTKGRTSAPISGTNKLISPENIFLEEGASVEHSILNASTGPIYLGGNAEILEGSIIRGGFALGNNAIVKMGAKIYGPTTAGPHCKLGGEVNNSVLFGYSNKGHEGFLGNSVLGEWCNMGADTNTSNMKNNYAQVRLWSYETENFARTGLQFCGLMMGDHSKCGINTMFNTGTVVGVNANIFGSGYPRNFIPSYSWGGASGFTTFLPKKANEVATTMMKRRGIEFDEKEVRILEHVFELTEKWRNY